jgi:hypothetical protein
LSYGLSFLLTNKIEAFLQRDFYKGSSQTVPFKGRDLFDIVWFIQRSAKSDLPLKPDWSNLISCKAADLFFMDIIRLMKSFCIAQEISSAYTFFK